jgi:uncharacterized protein
MMRFLLDSNIWLEGLLNQVRAEQVREFLSRTPRDQLALTEFALYSIGVHLCRKGAASAYLQFVDQLVIADQVAVLRVPPRQIRNLLNIAKTHRLDFDDAYQYTVAEIHDLHIVTFDTDFDRTPRGRLTPRQAGEILESDPK